MLPAFASVPLAGITRRDVQQRVNALAGSGLAAATVRHVYRAVFKSVLADAIDDGLLARSPCRRVELPAAVLPAIEPLAPAQIRTLADRIDPRYRAMVWLAAGCGLRWSEAVGLTRDRIHLGARARVVIDRQLAYRPATTHHRQETSARPLFAPPETEAARRIIPLPATVTAALRAHLRAYPAYLTRLLPAQLLGGAGVGLAFPSLLGAGSPSLSPGRFGTGSGILNMARQVGTVLGVAALVAILAHAAPDPVTIFRLAIVLVIGFFAAAGLVAAILLTAKAAAPPAPATAPATRPAERAR